MNIKCILCHQANQEAGQTFDEMKQNTHKVMTITKPQSRICDMRNYRFVREWLELGKKETITEKLEIFWHGFIINNMPELP